MVLLYIGQIWFIDTQDLCCLHEKMLKHTHSLGVSSVDHMVLGSNPAGDRIQLMTT